MKQRVLMLLLVVSCLAFSKVTLGEADNGLVATTTRLTLAPTSTPATLTLTLTVAAESGSGTPAGTVSAVVDGNTVTTVTLAGNDTMTWSVPSWFGSLTITANYSGGEGFAPSSYTLIGVTPGPLVIGASALAAASTGIPYSQTLGATGGTAPYSWSISSGSLPAGLSLSASTGVISGTPTAEGTSKFTVRVADSGYTQQSATAATSITVGTPVVATAQGTTWYVRPDGGTRYSSKVTNGQCDGLGDAAYSGTGVNQHCAFSDVRYFWQDGSYTTGAGTGGNAGFPGWGWIGHGGDTYLIRGSIGTGVSYRIGWNNGNNSWDPATNQYWGLAGDPFDSFMPAPLAGTPSQHTKILGENFASCHAASAKTQLHGGYGVYEVVQMEGAQNVDLACLDITDFSNCTRSGLVNICSTNGGSLSDDADNGITWTNTAINDTLTDVHIHGLATNGMLGSTGGGEVFSYLDIIGNGSSGWNADRGDGTTGTGTVLIQNFNISWNGCEEEYPIVDALPYQSCADDNSGGYGDGFGTATTLTNGWKVHFDQGVASYNTQDGLDALHLVGPGSSMTITRTLAYGNMGQQIKIGGSAGTAINDVIVGNCNALRQPMPGTPAGYNRNLSDFCRAADTAVLLAVEDGANLVFDDNTVYSANSTAFDISCGGSCTDQYTVDYRNNIFVGFLNTAAAGYPSGGNGQYPGIFYWGSDVPNDPFTEPGSLFANNVTYNQRSTWTCPGEGESNAICSSPDLIDQSWHVYGYGNMAPAGGSRALGAGVEIPSIPTDYTGAARSNPPTIGAYQQ